MKKHVGFVSRHFQCFQSVYTELVDCEKLFKRWGIKYWERNAQSWEFENVFT